MRVTIDDEGGGLIVEILFTAVLGSKNNIQHRRVQAARSNKEVVTLLRRVFERHANTILILIYGGNGIEDRAHAAPERIVNQAGKK